MKRAIWLALLLVPIMSFWDVSTKTELRPTKGSVTDSVPLSTPETASPTPQPALAPVVKLRAASNATIPFKTQNGEAANGVPSQTMDVPHLVLFRNGTLTDAEDCTLGGTCHCTGQSQLNHCDTACSSGECPSGIATGVDQLCCTRDGAKNACFASDITRTGIAVAPT